MSKEKEEIISPQSFKRPIVSVYFEHQEKYKGLQRLWKDTNNNEHKVPNQDMQEIINVQID